MRNFAYASNPKVWGDYFGHVEVTNLCKKYVINGARSLPRSLFVSGPSGVGKTALIRLLIRSFRCQNRPADDPNPCGTCPACLDSDERLGDKTFTDVYWNQPGGGEDETLYSQVKTSLASAARGQVRTNRPETDVKWVVFDEWQAFPSNIQSEVLLRTELEVPGNNVCYVFLTMQEDRLSEQNKIALMRRGSFFRLLPFSNGDMQRFIAERWPKVSPEVRAMIANRSRGSTGLAVAYYDNICQIDSDLNIDVASYVLGQARNDHRWALWQALNTRQRITTLQESLEFLQTKVEPLELSRQLHQDLLRAMDLNGVPTADQLYASEMLLQYQAHYHNTSLITYLIALMGMNLVTEAAVLATSGVSFGYTSV